MGGLFRRMGHAKPYVYTSPLGCANDVEGGLPDLPTLPQPLGWWKAGVLGASNAILEGSRIVSPPILPRAQRCGSICPVAEACRIVLVGSFHSTWAAHTPNLATHTNTY